MRLSFADELDEVVSTVEEYTPANSRAGLSPDAAPKQGNEGSPEAWLALDQRFNE